MTILRSALAIFALLFAAATPAIAQRVSTERFNNRDAVPQEIIVRFRDMNNGAIVSQSVRNQDPDITSSTPVGRSGAMHLRSKSRSVAELMQAYSSRPDVEYAEPNYVWRASDIPNDTLFGDQWALQNTGQVVVQSGTPGADIMAMQAWDVAEGSRGIVVGMVDSGIEYTHPDLLGNIWSAPSAFTVQINGLTIQCAAGTHGFNAITRNCDPMDDEGHGTHTAGIVGASGDNVVGVSGVSRIASLMALKFLDNSGQGTTLDAIAAIEFAIQVKKKFPATANVRVLNASSGGLAFSQALLDEINLAGANDMLFVAAAGNSSQNNDASPSYPSSYSAANIIAVAATDNRDHLADFSNSGLLSVHLAAPGVEILSTLRGKFYGRESGTSMSAAVVTGAASLILSACGLNTASLKTNILSSVDAIPGLAGVTISGGRLNVNNAIRNCAGATPAAFTLMVSPANQTIAFGAGNQFAVSVNPLNGFASIVALSAINLPAGMSATFAPATLANGTSTLSIDLSPNIAQGTYFIGIMATGGGMTRTTGIIVTAGLPSSCTFDVALGSRTGTLDTTDAASIHRPPSYADFCTFTLDSDRAITIEMRSGAINSFIYLLSSTGTVIASDDNGLHSGQDAQIQVQLSAGTYTIEATTTIPGQTGSYTLYVSLTRPTLTSVSPNFGTQGTTVDVTLTGTVFYGAPFFVKAFNCPGIVVSNIQVINVTTATATLTLPNNIGTCQISASNPGGDSSLLSFTIYPLPPVISGITPNSALQGQNLQVTINGSNFVGGIQISFNGALFSANSVTPTSVTFTAFLSVNLQPGVYPIKVITSGGTSNSASFTVVLAPPALSPLTPSVGGPGISTSITLSGNSFAVPIQINAGPNISVTNVIFVDSNRVTATFTVASDAAFGDYPITITTSAGTSQAQIFKVLPPPQITSFTPTRLFLGMTTTVVLTGTNFYCPPVNITIDGTGAFPFQGTNPCSSVSHTISIQVLNTAPLGTRTLRLVGANGTSNPITLNVVPVPAIIQSITPTYGAEGSTISVTITGSGMNAGTVNISGAGVQATTLTSTSSSLTASLSIAANAPIGPRDLTVTNANGISDPVTFTVTPPTWPDLTVSQAIPPILGSGFDETYSITVRNVGTKETTGPITVVDTLSFNDVFVSTGPGGQCSSSNGVVTCTIGQSIPANSELTFQMVVTTFHGTGGNTNVVEVLSAEDYNIANNKSTVLSQVVGVPLPKIVVSNGSLQPGQQATISVTLPSLFPHALADSLDTVTMSFTPAGSGNAADPAAQFAVGGKSISYSFKANTLSADLAGISGPMGFQAGTVAGTFTFTLSFRVGTGQPFTSTATASIASAAPAIKDLSTVKTSTGFDTVMTLLSSTKEVRSLILKFNTGTPIQLSCGGVPGCSAAGSVLTFNVTSVFNTWYANNPAYGSVAIVRVPLNLQGALTGSITVTFNNSLGNSNSMDFNIP